MVTVTHAERVVFPAVGITKGEVVRYYERIATKLLVHAGGRPLTIKRYPKGVGAPGFFQKNVPPHYPASMARVELPKNEGVTTHAILSEPEHVAFIANQGAIEIHVPGVRANAEMPDRLVVDLDPPEGKVALARRAAAIVRARLASFGAPSALVATGSKGYHVVAPMTAAASFEAIGAASAELAALLAHEHPDELSVAFRVGKRGGRVFVDWLRNMPHATFVAPFSLRARPNASVAVPLAWSELDDVSPGHFTLRDVDALVDRQDPLAELAKAPADGPAFVANVRAAFVDRGLTLERFDRFRS